MKLFFFLILTTSCFACGPWIPETYVLRNDDVFYAPPKVGFGAELRYLIPEKVPYSKLSNEPADLIDELSITLKGQALSEERQNAIIAAYRTFCETLDAAKKDLALQGFPHNQSKANVQRVRSDQEKAYAKEVFASLEVPDDLPLEFNHYFKGALAYHCLQYDEARMHWQALLALPTEDRPFYSVMAAYMLGRIGGKKAASYYQLVRKFVDQGFSDFQGLAAASYGWEAHHYLYSPYQSVERAERYQLAVDLYLKQWASGYSNAEISLAITAREIFEHVNDKELGVLMRNRSTRAILTTYLLTKCSEDQADTYRERLRAALPAPGELYVEEAGRFALLDYQQNNLSAVSLWLDYADPEDALALWVRSKLLLRNGKIDEGRTLMVTLTREFSKKDPDWRRVNTKRAWSELGLLMLQKQRFIEAADCFVNADSWGDYAYVLERVFSTEELIDWAQRQNPNLNDEDSNEFCHATRALTARRLMREGHFEEALGFFDAEVHKNAVQYIEAMRIASDSTLDPELRAQYYWEAARLMYTYGMSLIGSELAPDFAWHNGNYTWPNVAKKRMTAIYAEGYQINKMSWEERKRAAATAIRPNKRFHYRYRAARIAELAAGLLPNNNENAARIYHVAGGWLRLRDPDEADRFYKQLVVRCPETELGRAGSIVNWFPKVDPDTIKPFLD